MHSQSHSGDLCNAEDLLKGTALYKGHSLMQPSKQGTPFRLKIYRLYQGTCKGQPLAASDAASLAPHDVILLRVVQCFRNAGIGCIHNTHVHQMNLYIVHPSTLAWRTKGH